MELNITTDELRKAKIFVATPMYGGGCTGIFCKSTNDLAAQAARYGIDLKFYYLFNESLITRARNYCVDEFLRSDCTHLMFIDADIGFMPQDVFVLAALQMRDPNNVDVITAPYPKKSISWEKIVKAVESGKVKENPFLLEHFVGDFVFNPAHNVQNFRLDAPVEVMEAGTGFMLIPRSTFEKYDTVYPEYKYLPDHVRTEAFDGSREIMAYFDCIIDRPSIEQYVLNTLREVEDNYTNPDKIMSLIDGMKTKLEEDKKNSSNRYLSEDYMFCQNVRKADMKVWMCPWMELKHMGSYLFGGSLAALASIQASPTASNLSNKKYYDKVASDKKVAKNRQRNKARKPRS